MIKTILSHSISIMVALGLILTAIGVWVAYQRARLSRHTREKGILAMDRKRIKEIRRVLYSSFHQVERMSHIVDEAQAQIDSCQLKIENHVRAMKGDADRPLNSDLDLMSDSLSFVGEGHDLETYEECLIVLEELAGQTDRLVYSARKMLTQTHGAQEFLDKTVSELIPFMEELEEMEKVHKGYKRQIRRGKRKLEKILKKLVEINIITKMI